MGERGEEVQGVRGHSVDTACGQREREKERKRERERKKGRGSQSAVNFAHLTRFKCELPALPRPLFLPTVPYCLLYPLLCLPHATCHMPGKFLCAATTHFKRRLNITRRHDADCDVDCD